MKFLRCARCPYWRPATKIIAGLCPDCRKKLDALPGSMADQAAAEAGVTLVPAREVLAIKRPAPGPLPPPPQ